MTGVIRTDLEETEKRTTDKCFFTFNFRKYVAEGVVVSSIVTVTATKKNKVAASADLVVSGEVTIGQKIGAFFDGGTSGEDYDLVGRGIMSDGQNLAIAGLLHVLDRT